MADNIRVMPSPNGTDPLVATDDIGGLQYQKIKAGWGIDGVFQETADVDGVRYPVGGGQIGAINEAAPGSDIANSGLNGRLQRIAQRLTSLIAALPTALTTAGALRVGAADATITCSVAIGQSVSPAVDLGGLRNIALIIPSTFDGVGISFQGSDQLAGTYVPLYDITNQPVGITGATASRGYDLPGELMAWRFLKIVCGSAQAATTTDFIFVAKS